MNHESSENEFIGTEQSVRNDMPDSPTGQQLAANPEAATVFAKELGRLVGNHLANTSDIPEVGDRRTK
jgi:hypothetical protein